jgi:hypothetical protein
MNRLRLVALVLMVLLGASRAWAENPFDVGPKPADHGIVTVDGTLPAESGPTSPMLDQLRGVLARLTKQQLTDLRASAGGSGPPVQVSDEASQICVIHLSQGSNAKKVDIFREPAGPYVALEELPNGASAGAKPRGIRLNQDKFAKLLSSWPAYRGDFKLPKTSPKPGEAGELTDVTPGWFMLDKEIMGERFHGGQPTSLDIPERDLEAEPILVRLPKNYDPRTAYGVIVYIDPGEKASIYEPFHAAADEQGFIIVAAVHTGNGVHRVIRYQLALDGLTNVCERYLVDPRRVYASGVSGGGQITTHLWLCFPEIFTGAIPIVALASYENIPADLGQMWAATISKPIPKLLQLAKAHRCAAMTGGKDFNEKIVQDAVRILARDGFTMKVFDYPDMGHEVPKAERFAEALKWVDEPYRTVRERETKAADEALAKITANPSLTGEARKAALVEVTRVGPWTPAAWKAAEMLGVSPP